MRAQVAYRLRRIADKIAPAPTLVTRTPTIGELDDVWRYMEREQRRRDIAEVRRTISVDPYTTCTV